MNGRRVNRIFLCIVITNMMTSLVLTLLSSFFTMGVEANFILSQLIVLVPVLAGTCLARENPIKLAGFHKIKISTMLLVVLFTFLSMPLITLVNAISMLFVENTVIGMSEAIQGVPFAIMFLIIAVIGPLSEELVFRGILFQGYKRSGSVWKAILLSAILFSFMHMNFNQAAYTFVVGVGMALLVEATGSLWSSFLSHLIINGQSVVAMFLLPEDIDMEQAAVMTNGTTSNGREQMLLVISSYLIIAAVSTAIAACVLVFIAKNEKREELLRAAVDFRNDTKHEIKGRMVTVSLVTALVICLVFMIAMTFA